MHYFIWYISLLVFIKNCCFVFVVCQDSENPCIREWQTAGLGRRFSLDQLRWMCKQKTYFKQLLRNAPMMDAVQLSDKQRAYVDFVQHCRNHECRLRFASDQEEVNTQSDPGSDPRCKFRKKTWRPKFCDVTNHPACKTSGNDVSRPKFCQPRKGKRDVSKYNDSRFHVYNTELWLHPEQMGLRVKRQNGNGAAIRKEYRSLTDDERDAVHTAMNSLKKETIDNTNKWDLFTSFHYPQQGPSAHWGPAFLPWHREFLRQFEVALKNANPSFVGIPYWDSTLDYNLPDPRDSIIWTEAFMGNGNGFVKQGPFNSWPTLTPLENQPSVNNLYRDVGGSPFGGLLRQDDVKWVLNRTDFSQFSACVDPTFELLHGLPHIFIGGFMQIIRISPNDPIFYMHHSYVDYLWEQFRQQRQTIQQRLNDWAPSDKLCDDSHKMEGNMAPFSGLKNRDGLSEEYTRKWYRFYQSPSCDSDCAGSRYLWCDSRQSRCRAKIRRNGNCTGLDGTEVCYQSTCIQGVCTGSSSQTDPSNIVVPTRPFEITDDFVTPIPVIQPRTPNPPPVDPVLPDTIAPPVPTMPPGSYNGKSTDAPPPNPGYPTVFIKTFMIDENGAVTEGQVQVEGINYKETSNFSPITRFKYPEHPGIVYVQVKDPGKSFVQAKLTAYDRQGRQCRSYCAQGGYYKNAYVPCAGQIALSSQADYSNPVPFTANPEVKRFLNADFSMKPNAWKVRAPYLTFLCGSETDPTKIQQFADTVKPDMTQSDHVWFHVLVLDGRVPYHRGVPGARIEATTLDYGGTAYRAAVPSDTAFPHYFGVATVKAQNPAKTGSPVKVDVKAFDAQGNRCTPTCQQESKNYAKCQGRVTLSADPAQSDTFSFSSDDDMKDFLNWDMTEHPASWRRMISSLQFVC